MEKTASMPNLFVFTTCNRWLFGVL
jgi:hypothetical protein